DTLRLEMRFPLYGNDIDETTTPLEAGLDFTVKFSKQDFVGKEALDKQRNEGVPRRLIGFKLEGRGIPRQGYALLADGRQVGRVASGSMSPTWGEPIGMGEVDTPYAQPGTARGMEVRGRRIPGRVVEGRFVEP